MKVHPEPHSGGHSGWKSPQQTLAGVHSELSKNSASIKVLMGKALGFGWVALGRLCNFSEPQFSNHSHEPSGYFEDKMRI